MKKNQNILTSSASPVAAEVQNFIGSSVKSSNNKTIDTRLLKFIKNLPFSKIAGLSGGKTSSNTSHAMLYNYLPREGSRKLLNNINTILNYFFASFYILISKPVLLFTPGKLVISLNYYKPEPNSKLSNRYIWKYGKVPSRSGTGLHSELTGLIDILSKLTNKKVELQLNQLNYPFHDSTILSKLISLNTNKKKFSRIIRILMSKATIITKNFGAPRASNKLSSNPGSLYDGEGLPFLTVKNEKGQNVSIHTSTPTVLSGIRIQISGRLATQRVVPKRTISKKQKGGFACTNRNIVEFAQYTNKNKRGAYTVKV
jgi:hypothetical protein